MLNNITVNSALNTSLSDEEEIHSNNTNSQSILSDINLSILTMSSEAMSSEEMSPGETSFEEGSFECIICLVSYEGNPFLTECEPVNHGPYCYDCYRRITSHHNPQMRRCSICRHTGLARHHDPHPDYTGEQQVPAPVIMVGNFVVLEEIYNGHGHGLGNTVGPPSIHYTRRMARIAHNSGINSAAMDTTLPAPSNLLAHFDMGGYHMTQMVSTPDFGL